VAVALAETAVVPAGDWLFPLVPPAPSTHASANGAWDVRAVGYVDGFASQGRRLQFPPPPPHIADASGAEAFQTLSD
jgi:hypothetical protein